MQNKYLINFSRKFWFWFWSKLMNGFAPSDSQGNYKRPKGIILNKNYDFNSNSEDFFLLVGNSCPWCHRTLLTYQIKNLSKKVKIIYLKANINSGQWIFYKEFMGCNTLYEFYKKAGRGDTFRATIPLLVSCEKDFINILSSESNQIVKLLNSIKNKSSQPLLQIYNCDQELIKLIHHQINDGVYKCGFARNQSSYERASKSLFIALTKIESILDKKLGNWICGEKLTYADIFLFPTLIRWELIYSKLFKCTEKEISDFKNIMKWRFKFYMLNKVSDTCFDYEWKKDYYKALFPLNPNQIIPLLPSIEEIIKSPLK